MSYIGSNDRFVTGINYWPRSSAMYAWERFDRREWDDDFALLAQLGIDAVRFFLSWEYFQPSAASMSKQAIDQCVNVMDMLASHGLAGMPTLFCGHMSGVNWLPEWALDSTTPSGRFRTIANGREQACGIGDMYGDPRLLAAQELFAREIARALAGHPALACWDLGNEFSNLRIPATQHDANEWSRRLSAAIHEFSDAPVTGGTHGEDLAQDRNIRPSSFCAPWPFACMHGYSVYSAFAIDRLDTEVVPFLSDLMATFAAKPVLFAEYGNPTCPPGLRSPSGRIALPDEPAFGQPIARAADEADYVCLNEEEMAEYGVRIFEKLHARGALGAMWWCFADYDPALANVPPFDSRAARAALRHRAGRRLEKAYSDAPRGARAGAAPDSDAGAARDFTGRILPGTPREHRPRLYGVYRRKESNHVRMMAQSGRTVIITGASSGFGRELALQAAAAGYAIVAVARRRDLLESLESEIGAAGGQCLPLVLDVRRKDAPSTIVNAAFTRFGRIDIIVHAAGLAARGDISAQTEASNAEQFETHVLAPLAITRAALEHLAQSRGAIFFIGSGVARLPITGLGAYPPAKAAIRSAAAIMRRELRARSISVTYVDPGAVATEFMHRAGMEGPPANVLLAPADVAAKILRAFERQPANLSASIFQSAMVALGALFPAVTGAVLERLPDLVGTAPLEPPRAPLPVVAAEPALAPAVDAHSSFDAALASIRPRMAKFALREETVRDALERGKPITLGEFAMQWAGMPNKHERALTGDVLTTLEHAGFLEPAGEEAWNVVKKP